jgi:carbamoyltransferase
MLFTYKSNQQKKIPSCIHEDKTARVQTLSKEDNSLLHNLIFKFEEKTACPILINTSFNVRGEPIVAKPLDALKCFFQTDMDVLALGNYIVLKTENTTNIPEELTKIQEYELD